MTAQSGIRGATPTISGPKPVFSALRARVASS